MAFNTKFSLPSFLKQVNRLTNNQRNSIKRVGFGNLLHIPNQVIRRFQLLELIERWSCEKQAFVFPRVEITITLLDVALILGLRVVGQPVVLNKDEPFTNLEKEFGVSLWNRTITVASLKKRLVSLGERDDEYFVMVFLLYCFGTILFPSGNGKGVDSRYLSLLQNLDNMRNLAWGAAVLADLHDCLSLRKTKKTSSVGGCLILLQIWCYEHIVIGRPKLLDCSTFPRACRWGNMSRQYIKSHDDCQLFAIKLKELEHSQILWELQPTSEEAHIDIVMELLQEQECRSNDISVEKESSVRTKCGMLEQPINVEGETVIDIVEVHEDAKESRTPQENESVALRTNKDVPSTYHHMPEVPKVQREQHFLSQGKSTNFILIDDDKEFLNTKSETLGERNVELKLIGDLKKEKEQTKKLEDENLELKVILEDLRKEHELMKRFKEENVELRNLVETLRRENQVLSLSMDKLVSRLERIVLDDNVA